MAHRYSKYIKDINLVGDIIFLNIAYIFVFNLFGGHLSSLFRSSYFELQLFSNISWIISAYLLNVHDNSRALSVEKVIKRLLKALGLYLLLIFAFVGVKNEEFSKLFVLQAYIATTAVVSVFNLSYFLALNYYRRKGYNYRKVVVAGYGEMSQELRNFFGFHPENGYKFYGFFDDHYASPQVRGTIDDIKKIAMEKQIDEIYCLLPYLEPGQVSELVNFGDDNFVKVKIIPDFRGFPSKDVEVRYYNFIPVLNFRNIPLEDHFNYAVKRTFDVLFSLLVIIFIMSWVFPLIALLIKLDSPGPVIFKQKRTGKNNRPFVCYKFRTMRINNRCNTDQTCRNDPRVTKFGAFLRKSSLDELPQFFNVLAGDMSVVGPRPHMLKHTEEFSKTVEKFMVRHSIKPGITGLAQAKGYRGETNTNLKIKNRVKLDRFYIEKWSFFFDLKIIFMTVGSLIRGNENAF